MLRFLLVSVLLSVVALAIQRFLTGITEALKEPTDGSTRSRAPRRTVPMVRDPVCGTFVLPDRAVSIVEGRSRVFFCSEACRDKYRARTA